MISSLDDKLLDGLKKGKHGSFKKLHKLLGDEIFRYIRRYFPYDHHQAEDIFQEVFLMLYTRAGSIRNADCIRSWLYRTATNKCIDMKRKSKRNPAPAMLNEELAGTSEHHSVERTVLKNQITGHLNKAVDSLNDRQRQVFIMREFQGLKYGDISEITGLSLSIVKKAMTSSVLKVQTALSRHKIDYKLVN